jgi:hypothetical protein
MNQLCGSVCGFTAATLLWRRCYDVRDLSGLPELLDRVAAGAGGCVLEHLAVLVSAGDLNVPGLHRLGYFARKVGNRHRRPARNRAGIPVIFLSGAALEELPERHRDRPLVQKPYTKASLLVESAGKEGESEFLYPESPPPLPWPRVFPQL